MGGAMLSELSIKQFGRPQALRFQNLRLKLPHLREEKWSTVEKIQVEIS